MALIIRNNLPAQGAARALGEHMTDLAVSVRRLSSGLRVGTAADDPAGLAVRELMRSEVTALNQGVRNANDAVSLLQTADGAMQVIDEKLIRMKELAMQAATGSYNSDQRQIINREFQAMGQEVQRIADATDFNGIHLLNGGLPEVLPGSGLKVHFGPGNDSAEDYYFINIEPATLSALGLSGAAAMGTAPSILQFFGQSGATAANVASGAELIGVIPRGSENVTIILDGKPLDDDLQLFTTSGVHLAGTDLTDEVWDDQSVTPANVDATFITPANGFTAAAAYDPSVLINGRTAPFIPAPPFNAGNAYDPAMTIGYSGDGDLNNNEFAAEPGESGVETLHIDFASEDLLLFSVGVGDFDISAAWSSLGFTVLPVDTQEGAQEMLERLDSAIIRKNNIRANLGAMQNRLENTIANLQIQAENLRAAESRISDLDYATAMTTFIRDQILRDAAGAMLAQANSLPRMALELMRSSS